MQRCTKRKDPGNFEGIFMTQSEAKLKKSPGLLRKTGSEKAGAVMPRIRINDDAVQGRGVVTPYVLITWSAAKKANKTVKEGREKQ